MNEHACASPPLPAIRRKSLFFSASVLLVVAMSTLAACGGQGLDGGTRHSFFVRGALAPPVHSSQGGCTYSNDPRAALLLEGRVDLGVTDAYQVTLLAEGTDPAASTSITGAHVVLRTVSQDVLREFEAVTTGFIGPNADALAFLTVLDATASDLLLPMLPNRMVMQTLVADVTLRGRDAAGGPEVTSPVFSFPFHACNGCLVDFSTGNDDTAGIQPNCLKPIDPAAVTPCFIGQDETVSCQLCVRSRPACDPRMLSP
jgi:hypothetical protein